MMTVDPKKRTTVTRVLLHPWLRDSHMREEVYKLISTVETDENMPPLNVLNNNHEDDSKIMIKRARFLM